MNSTPSRRSNRSRSKLGGIAVVVLVGVYSLAAPYLNDRFGLELPALRADSNGQVRVIEEGQDRVAEKSPATTNNEQPTAPIDHSASKVKPKSPSKQSRGPLADRMRPSNRGGNSGSANTKEASTAKHATQSDEEQFGILKEISRDRYVSPAGLLYTPGSAEGHRLEHLRRHTKDDPGRPGSHGVFDGGMEGALKTIDRAYERAKKGQRTTTKQDKGRTIYTVDMGGRVGYVGGRDGNRKRKPMARRVRIVLDGRRVITAYPM